MELWKKRNKALEGDVTAAARDGAQYWEVFTEHVGGECVPLTKEDEPKIALLDMVEPGVFIKQIGIRWQCTPYVDSNPYDLFIKPTKEHDDGRTK